MYIGRIPATGLAVTVYGMSTFCAVWGSSSAEGMPSATGTAVPALETWMPAPKVRVSIASEKVIEIAVVRVMVAIEVGVVEMIEGAAVSL